MTETPGHARLERRVAAFCSWSFPYITVCACLCTSLCWLMGNESIKSGLRHGVMTWRKVGLQVQDQRAFPRILRSVCLLLV